MLYMQEAWAQSIAIYMIVLSSQAPSQKELLGTSVAQETKTNTKTSNNY